MTKRAAESPQSQLQHGTMIHGTVRRNAHRLHATCSRSCRSTASAMSCSVPELYQPM